MSEILSFSSVTLRREENDVLTDVDWAVFPGERWVILGPNGSGKTTALKLASGQLHPTSGVITILGAQLGHVDVRELRKRIGFVSGAMTRTLRPQQTAHHVVVAGKYAALEVWWDDYSQSDREHASRLLSELGVASIADREFAVISEGERQQVLLARALMGQPELLLLDEPFAGLDLGARERLLTRLSRLVDDAATPPLVLVTHHAEEIPPGMTHAGLLRDGHLFAAGPLREVLTSENVSAAFGLPIEMGFTNNRWTAQASGRLNAKTALA